MATELQSLVAELETNIGQVVLGKAEVVRMCVVALLADDHVLLEDVPGVGKTLIGKALAKSISAASAAFSSPPTCCPATSPAATYSIRRPASSSTRAGRFSATSCWPTRSIARRPARKARCWRR